MIEFLVLHKLTQQNAYHAVRRGRSSSIAKLYTVLFWFVFECLGVFIGAAVCSALELPIKLSYLYILAALPMAILGGYISNRVSRRGEAFYTPPS